MRFRTGVVYWLDPALTILGGPAAAARYVGRHVSTVHRWRTGEWPIPPHIAAQLVNVVDQWRSHHLYEVACELRQRQRAGEERLARARVARRRGLRSSDRPAD